MSPLRRAERSLVRAAERVVDAPRRPVRAATVLAAAYLQLRHRLLLRAIRGGALWTPSALRLALAVGVGRGDRVLDLGANLGRVSQEAAWRVGRAGRVDAFEPSPAVADRLERRLERLGLDDRVVVRRWAVGAEAGTAPFYEYAHRDGGASSLRRQDHVGAPPDEVRPVRVVTVDDYLEDGDRGPVDLIKVDVEGAEVEVLRGARRTLASTPRPALVVEAAPVTQRGFDRTVQPLLDTLHQAGYETWACRRSGLVPVCHAGDLLPERRREDLLALHPRDHGPLLRSIRRLSPGRGPR